MSAYPSPVGGASLLVSFKLHRQTVVIVGANTLAASRAFAALEADSTVVVLVSGGLNSACEELKWRADNGQLRIIDLDLLPCSVEGAVDRHAQALDDYLGTLGQVRLVCVTDTLLSNDSASRRSRTSAQAIAHACRLRNIPLNVTDMPDLCDFSFLSTHRFQNQNTGAPSPLQIGVTTNGQGCRLATRIRREVVATLPKEVGSAAANVGKLRGMAKASVDGVDADADAELNEEAGPSTPNRPVSQRRADESAGEIARRRMKWVAQVSEYWPIPKLARMTPEDMAGVLDEQTKLNGAHTSNGTDASAASVSSLHGLALSQSPRRGRIFLVGSGPGHPALLTVATRDALTKRADLVLSDKLVPAAVLAVIPPHVEVRIARKFPGNADYGQAELMEAAIEAARRGLTVVRVSRLIILPRSLVLMPKATAKARRPVCIWKSRRRDSVLPRAWFRAYRRAGSELCPRRTNLRRHTRDAARGSRVFHRLHRSWQGRQTGPATRLCAQPHLGDPHGRCKAAGDARHAPRGVW